ncbi:MAG: hypothetical protein ABIQ85_04005 [Cypionkella sp.]|jgi:hypothetical protein
MLDEFDKHATGITAPALHATALTPSDSTPLSVATRAIYVGTAGNLRVEMVSGDVVTLTAVAAGAIYPLRVAQVMATGTTATNLVGLR